MSKRPLTRRVGLCYVAAAGLQHSYGAAGATATATTAVDDDLDIVSLGAMQPPLTNQAQPSSFGLAGRPRPAETSFGKEESPDQTLARLLQHTFGALGSALDDSKLDLNMLPAGVDQNGGTTAPTRERSERRPEEAPSRVVLGEDDGQQPAGLDAAEIEKLAGVGEAEPEAERAEEEEEEEGGEGEEEEEGSEQDTLSVGTGVASEVGSQQEGAVSTESHSGQGPEVEDAVNGSIHTAAVVAVTADEDDVDTGNTADLTDAIQAAAVTHEEESEAGAALDAVPVPVRSADSPPEPGVGEASGTGLVEEEDVGDVPTGASASEDVEAFGEGGLGQHLEGGTTASGEVEAFGEGGLEQHREGGATASGEGGGVGEGGLGQHLEGGTMASKDVEAFGEGGSGKHGEWGTTKSEEVAEAVSEGGLGEHRGGGVPATGDLIGQENEIGESGPVVPGDALVIKNGGFRRTANGTDPIQVSPAEDTGATGEVATSGDAASTDALAASGGGGGGGGADNAGVGEDSAGIDDASDGSTGEARLDVLELEVEVEETGVPDGAIDDQEIVAAPPEIDGHVDALEAEAAAPMSGDVQESDASERNVAETLVVPDDTIIGVVEGSGAGDRSESHGHAATDVPFDMPLIGTEVDASAETTGDAQEHSTTAVGAIGGTGSGEALAGSAEDDDTSRTESSDAPAGSSAERYGPGGQGPVEHGRGAEALEAPASAKGGGLPEADAAAVDVESDGARGVGVGEVAGSPLGGVGEAVGGSASEPSETGAPLEDRLRSGDAPAGEGDGVGDASRDAVDTPKTSPAGSEGGNDKTGGLGSEGGSEDESPRERRVFRFSEPPGSRAAGDSAGLPGTPGDASSADGAKKFSMPPIKPIDVSPDALQKFRLPEDTPEEAGSEGTEEWSAWGKRWAGVVMEAAVQVAKVAGGRGGTAANRGLEYCKAQALKAWREVVGPRAEEVRLRLETAAMAGLDEVGEHLADPMLAEAI